MIDTYILIAGVLVTCIFYAGVYIYLREDFLEN